MSETEGVIKYNLDHQQIALDNSILLSELNTWRTILFKLKLIGKIEERYQGYGFGNISQRVNSSDTKAPQFIISGTQTGGIGSLSKHHYCLVLQANPIKNSISSKGQIKPSSEALTHATLYQQDKQIQTVIHIHSPEIWKNTKQLKLAYTSADITYGTAEMANEVERLMQTEQLKNEKIFSMLGHEDGIIAFSDSLEDAALSLIKYFYKAVAIEQNRL